MGCAEGDDSAQHKCTGSGQLGYALFMLLKYRPWICSISYDPGKEQRGVSSSMLQKTATVVAGHAAPSSFSPGPLKCNIAAALSMVGVGHASVAAILLWGFCLLLCH